MQTLRAAMSLPLIPHQPLPVASAEFRS